jgi:hypothetical protein
MPIIAWHKLDDPEIAASEFENVTVEKLKELLKKGAPSSKAFSKAIVQIAEERCPEDEATYDARMVCGVERGPNTFN